MRRRETDRTKANCTQYTDRIRRIGGCKGGHWEVVGGGGEVVDDEPRFQIRYMRQLQIL